MKTAEELFELAAARGLRFWIADGAVCVGPKKKARGRLLSDIKAHEGQFIAATLAAHQAIDRARQPKEARA